MFKIDLHTHTIASKDALNTVYEMIRTAHEKGVELLALTEHGPRNPCGPPLNYFVTSVKIPRRLFGIEIMIGCETTLEHSGPSRSTQLIIRFHLYQWLRVGGEEFQKTPSSL